MSSTEFDWQLFKDRDLYPALFERINEAFPEFKFKRFGNKWASPYHIDGERDSKGALTTYIYENNPYNAHDYARGNKGVIDLYMEINNKTFSEAIKELANICGIELPSTMDSESLKRWEEKQQRLEEAASRMVQALYSDEGAATLKYLKESRGYDDEFIRYAQFGYASPSMEAELRKLFQGGSKFPREIGSTYKLVFPYRLGGTIKGMIFRSINPGTEPGQKYKKVFVSEKAENSFYLKMQGEEATMVEGEICALRASYVGVPNVFAIGNKTLKKDVIEKIAERGIKRVNILLDADQKATEEEIRHYGDIQTAINHIKEAGMEPYICSFPYDGDKVDVDDYLRTHTGEELKQLIKDAASAPLWLCERLSENIKKQQGQTGKDKLLNEYLRQFSEIYNTASPLDRARILMKAAKDAGLPEEALKAEADSREAARQKKEAEAIANDVLRLTKEGSVEEAISLMKEKLPGLTQAATEEEFIKDLELPTLEDLRKRRRERPTGLKTGYSFKGKFYEYPFILPSGGLTLICGQTSHGKSRMLENLALQIAQNEEEGSVIYFTFEEDEVAVEIQMLNIYANIEITSEGNNLYTLNEYYSGSTQYFKAGTLEEFKRKEASFDKLLTSGKLRILAKYNDATRLANAIRSYSKNTKVKAVFVDYVQLMRLTGTRALNRKDELRDVCEILKDVAKDTRLPIVLAAQLNRSAASPVDMSCQNLADAADIEHAANVVMLLWNSAVKPKAKEGNTYYTDRAKGTLSPEAQRLEEMGFEMGRPGKLYAVLDKNRGGERYVDAVLDFDMNTGYIKPNYSQEPKQGEIFENGF